MFQKRAHMHALKAKCLNLLLRAEEYSVYVMAKRVYGAHQKGTRATQTYATTAASRALSHEALDQVQSPMQNPLLLPSHLATPDTHHSEL
jgi:hypothetical protein